MDYVARVRRLLYVPGAGGSGAEWVLAEIVQEATRTGYCVRDFVILNNACFRFLDEFKTNWRQEMSRFCAAVGLRYSVADDGCKVEFWKEDPSGRGEDAPTGRSQETGLSSHAPGPRTLA